MRNQISRLLMVVLAVTLPLAAPAAEAQSRPAPPPEVQQWITQLQRTEATLMAIQAKALETPELKREKDAIEAALRGAIVRADPGLQAEMQRVPALRQRAVAAQKSGNQAELKQAAEAGATLQRRFARAQQAALKDPALQRRITAFESRLQRRMLEVDSRTPQLLEQFRQLGAKLEAAARAQAGRGQR